MAIGGIALMAALAAGAPIRAAHAQAMAQTQALNGFNALDPQWTFANPFMSSGFGTGSNMATAIDRQTYAAPFGSGTMGLFVESSGGGANAISSNMFGTLPTSQRQEWFANLGSPASFTSVYGSYKSTPDTSLNGLYTTASFGVASIRANPLGFSGLPNFSAGNDVSAVSARAGVGLQLTPQISIEGSVGFTQGPISTFR